MCRFISLTLLVGMSKYSNAMFMQAPPVLSGDLVDGCEEPLINELPTEFVRMSTFQSSIRESPSGLFIPTTVRTRDQSACDFKRGTKMESDVDCEVFPSTPQTYGEAYYNTNATTGLFEKQYLVIDPLRHVLIVGHAPAIGQLTPWTGNFKTDYADVTGYARGRNSDNIETLPAYSDKSLVIADAQQGFATRNLKNQYDYLPMSWIMELAGLTHNCSKAADNTELEYMPLMNGVSISVNVRYSNRVTWHPFGNNNFHYVITADAVRHNNINGLNDDDKEDTSFYYEYANFEHTESNTMKFYGIRISVTTSATVTYFDPVWVSASFLPQFLALITTAGMIIRYVVLYGGTLGGLQLFFSACNLCRPSRTFKQLCSSGSRSVWYRKYMMNTTPNMAAIDYMIRSLAEERTVTRMRENALVSGDDAMLFKGDKRAVSAFNDPLGMVLHHLPNHEMHVQLNNFYRKEKARLSADARRFIEERLVNGDVSEYSSDEEMMAMTTSVELQTAFLVDKDDAKVVNEREIDIEMP